MLIRLIVNQTRPPLNLLKFEMLKHDRRRRRAQTYSSGSFDLKIGMEKDARKTLRFENTYILQE